MPFDDDQLGRLEAALEQLESALSTSDVLGQLDALEQQAGQLTELLSGIDDMISEVEALQERIEALPDTFNDKVAGRIEEATEDVLSEFEVLLEELPEDFVQAMQEHFEASMDAWVEEKTESFQSIGSTCEDTIGECVGNAEEVISRCFEQAVDEIRQSVEEGAREACADFISRAVVEVTEEIAASGLLASANIAVSQAISGYAPQIRAAKELAEQINDVM